MSVERIEIQVVESVTFIYRVTVHHTVGDKKKPYVASSGRKQTAQEAIESARDRARQMRDALVRAGSPAQIVELGGLIDVSA